MGGVPLRRTGRGGPRWCPGRHGHHLDRAPTTGGPDADLTTDSDPTLDPASSGSDDGSAPDDGAPEDETAPVGPVFGHTVGWSVFIGDPYAVGVGLWRLDLDTGQLAHYPEVSGAPVLAVGSRLLLQESDPTAGGGQLQVVTADDPSAVVATVDGPTVPYPGAPIPAVPADGDSLWLRHDHDGMAWQLVRLSDGAVLDEVGPGGVGLAWGGGPDVVTTGSGGVFRRDGDRYRQLAPGLPLTASGGDVLVRTCSSPADCELGWIDADTGQTVDRPVPPDNGADRVWQGLVPGSDRFLFGARFVNETAQLEFFDLVEGRIVEWESESWGGAAASPDGRYLLAEDGGRLSLYDADTGTWATATRPTVDNLSAVFVPNA